jgi:hypothetical protein
VNNETPFIPSYAAVKTFFLGALWVVLLSLPAVAVEMTDDYELDWRHLLKVGGAVAGPGLVAYWRKYRAMIMPPPA